MIRAHYTSQTNPQFRILSQDQIQEIHLAALKVLSRIGVEIPNADALSLLKGAGADVSGFAPKGLTRGAIMLYYYGPKQY